MVADQSALPFTVRRLYCLYDVPTEAQRGGHAHRTEEELIFAVAGSLRLTLDDGRTRRDVQLSRPDQALHVPALLWHELHAFAPGTVVVVLASTAYDASDYIHDYATFREHVRHRR